MWKEVPYHAGVLSQVALTVVMATKGYPGPYAKGTIINGLDDVTTAKV